MLLFALDTAETSVPNALWRNREPARKTITIARAYLGEPSQERRVELEEVTFDLSERYQPHYPPKRVECAAIAAFLAAAHVAVSDKRGPITAALGAIHVVNYALASTPEHRKELDRHRYMRFLAKRALDQDLTATQSNTVTQLVADGLAVSSAIDLVVSTSQS